MTEWSLVACVIVVLGLIFFRQVRVLQGRGELAAVRATLGALRTALVIDYLHKKIGSGNISLPPAQRNPFELLDRQPVNYLGSLKAADLETAAAGSWLFDSVCDCVGYVPLYSQWFVSPSGDMVAWYRLSGEPGPLQLTAREAYVWQDELMN